MEKISVDQIDRNEMVEIVKKDRLVLLPKDTKSMYAYWEFTEARKNLYERYFHCGWTELPKLLRVYDVTCVDFNGDNAQITWEIPMEENSNNWFIQDVVSERSYCLDYGTRTADGRFFTIFRSNVIEIPPQEERRDNQHPRNNNNASKNIQSEKIEVENDVSQRKEEPDWMKSFTGYSIAESLQTR